MIEQLVLMLQSRSGHACRTAAATLADLAMVSRESCEALMQVCALCPWQSCSTSPCCSVVQICTYANHGALDCIACSGVSLLHLMASAFRIPTAVVLAFAVHLLCLPASTQSDCQPCCCLPQEPVLPELVALLARAVRSSSRSASENPAAEVTRSLLDALAAAQALRIMAALDDTASDQIVGLGAVNPLLVLVKGRRGGTGLGSPVPAAQLLLRLMTGNSAL